jgi:Tol biopolymer transport system component
LLTTGPRQPSRALFWTAAALVFVAGAARFVGAGFLPATRALAGDFAASFPTEYFARLRPDFPASNVWPGWNYGPMFHFLTLPLLALPRYWMVPLTWALVNLAAISGSFIMVCRLSRAGTLLSPPVVLLAGLWLFFQPLANCFAQGNIEILEMMMILAALALLLRGREYSAGVLLGIATMTKLLPIGFLGWLAIRQRWRPVIAGLAVIALSTGIAAVTLDWSRNISLQRSDLVTDSPVAGVHELSITTFFAHRNSMLDYEKSTVRWFPSARARASVRAGTFASALFAAAFGLVLVLRRRAPVSPFEIGILFIAMFMIPPWNHDYYYVFALVPLSVVVLDAIAMRKWGVIVAVGVAYALMSPPIPYGLIDRTHLFPVAFAYVANYYDLPVLGALLLWLVVAQQMFAADDRDAGVVPRWHPGYFAAGIVAIVLMVMFMAPSRGRAATGPLTAGDTPAFMPPVSLEGDPALTLSPDGEHVAYAAVSGGTTALCIRRVADASTQCLDNSDGAAAPFFSPDGRSVGFFARNTLRVASVGAGAARSLARAVDAESGSWGTDDDILFTSPAGIFRVAASGGTPVRVVPPLPDGTQYRWPVALASGDAILVTTLYPGSSSGAGRIVVWSPKRDRPVSLVEGTQPYFDRRSGSLVFAIDGRVMAGRFDSARLEFSSTPVPIASDVMVAARGGAQFAVSAAGALVYLPGGGAAVPRSLAWVNRDGVSMPVGADPRAFVWPRLSSDGTRIAVTVEDAVSDVWVYGVRDLVPRRATFETTRNETPAWRPGPGEDALTYVQPADENSSVLLAPVNRPQRAVSLWTALGRLHLGGWSADGRWLAGSQGGDLWILRGSEEPRESETTANRTSDVTIIRAQGDDSQPAISPDGRWLAYTSTRSGRDEVLVRPLAAIGDATQVSVGGGGEPVWAPHGGELFFRLGTAMMSVAVQTGATFRAGQPRELFRGAFLTSADAADYDVARDGQRFLMVAAAVPSPQKVRFVRGWPAQLSND